MKHKTKKIFTIFTTIILLLSINITPAAQSIGSATNLEPLHYMGAKPDSPENIKNIYFLKTQPDQYLCRLQ